MSPASRSVPSVAAYSILATVPEEKTSSSRMITASILFVYAAVAETMIASLSPSERYGRTIRNTTIKIAIRKI